MGAHHQAVQERKVFLRVLEYIFLLISEGVCFILIIQVTLEGFSKSCRLHQGVNGIGACWQAGARLQQDMLPCLSSAAYAAAHAKSQGT